MAEAAKTLRVSGGDYTDMQTWWDTEADAYDYATNTTNLTLECYNDWPSGKDEVVNLSQQTGYNASSTYFPTVKAAAGEGHGGIPGTGFSIRTNVPYGRALYVNADYLLIKELAVENTSWNYSMAIDTRKPTCIVHSCIATAGINYGAFFVNSHNTFINCLAWNCTGYGWRIDDWNSATLINCGSVSCDNGIIKLGSNGAVTVKNCFGFNITGSPFWNQGGDSDWHASSTNNASDEATVTTPPGLNPIITDLVAGDFVDIANGDIHLSGTGSTLYQAGANLYFDGTEVDIDGDARPNSAWDIGPDQYVVSGPVTYTLSITSMVCNSSFESANLKARRKLSASTMGSSASLADGNIKVRRRLSATTQSFTTQFSDAQLKARRRLIASSMINSSILSDAILRVRRRLSVTMQSSSAVFGDVSLRARRRLIAGTLTAESNLNVIEVRVRRRLTAITQATVTQFTDVGLRVRRRLAVNPLVSGAQFQAAQLVHVVDSSLFVSAMVCGAIFNNANLRVKRRLSAAPMVNQGMFTDGTIRARRRLSPQPMVCSFVLNGAVLDLVASNNLTVQAMVCGATFHDATLTYNSNQPINTHSTIRALPGIIIRALPNRIIRAI